MQLAEGEAHNPSTNSDVLAGQQLKDFLPFLNASQLGILTEAGATTLEDLSLLTEDDWKEVKLGVVLKRRIRNVLLHKVAPPQQQMVGLSASANTEQSRCIQVINLELRH